MKQEHGWTDVVIKPTVGAGSFHAKHFTADQDKEAQAFLNELLADRDVMIQVGCNKPYQCGLFLACAFCSVWCALCGVFCLSHSFHSFHSFHWLTGSFGLTIDRNT